MTCDPMLLEIANRIVLVRSWRTHSGHIARFWFFYNGECIAFARPK